MLTKVFTQSFYKTMKPNVVGTRPFNCESELQRENDVKAITANKQIKNNLKVDKMVKCSKIIQYKSDKEHHMAG